MHVSNNKESDLNTSIDLLVPGIINENKFSFHELKNEYTRAFNYIDILKLEKNTLVNTMRLVSNRKTETSPKHYSLNNSKSISQTKMVTAAQIQNEKKIVQLEQENRDLKNLLAEHQKPRRFGEKDKNLILLEQENAELRKELDMKIDQLARFRNCNYNLDEIERLENNNRDLKNEVIYLNQEINAVTVKKKELQEMEEENLRTRRFSPCSGVSQETQEGIAKYVNYISGTIKTFSPNHSMRTCFEERFPNTREVQRLVHEKDYGSILLKSLKYISDVLINADNKSSLRPRTPLERSPSAKGTRSSLVRSPIARSPSATAARSPSNRGIRSPSTRANDMSDIMSERSLEASTSKRKSTIGENKLHIPLNLTSTSKPMNTPQVGGVHTPSVYSGQNTKSSTLNRQARTLSQQVSVFGEKESHIIYTNRSPTNGGSKKLSSVLNECLTTRENVSTLHVKRGSQTSRNESNIFHGNGTLKNSVVSPRTYRAGSKDRTNSIDAGPEEDKKASRLERNANKSKESFSASLASAGIRNVNRRGVNSESYMSIKNYEKDFKEKQKGLKQSQEDSRAHNQLKSVLKVSTYKGDNVYEAGPYRPQSSKNADNSKYNRFNQINENPFSPLKDNNTANTDFDARSRTMGSPNRSLSPQRTPERSPAQRSPLQRKATEPRMERISDFACRVSNQKENQRDDYERPSKTFRNDYSQKYVDEGDYEPTVLPKPQKRDKLEDFNASLKAQVGNLSPITNGYPKSNKSQAGFEDQDPFRYSQTNQFTFETKENTREGSPVAQNNYSKRLESSKSPPKQTRQNRTACGSFKVSFGRTESISRANNNSSQDQRCKSPSVLDIHKKKELIMFSRPMM